MKSDVQSLLRRLLRGDRTGDPQTCPATTAAIAGGWVVIRDGRMEVSKAGVAEYRRLRTVTQAGRAKQGESTRPSAVAAPSQRGEDASECSAATVAEPSSPLAWLSRRRDRDGNPLISREQLAAGNRLAADLWRARMTPRITSSWSGIPGDAGRRGPPGSGLAIPDIVIAARARVETALSAVGLEFAGLLIDVCGDYRGIEDLERTNGWPQRSGKIILQIALTRLARHYGLLQDEPSSRAIRNCVNRWAADDSKVDLESWQV